MRYYSVIGFGKASFINEIEEKREALNIIVTHYSDNSHKYSVNEIGKVAIIKVAVDSITWKNQDTKSSFSKAEFARCQK